MRGLRPRGAWLAPAIAALASAAIAVVTPLSAAQSTPPGSTGTTGCPTSNPPNTLSLVAGTPQTAKLGAQFESGLQVELANTDGCPLTTAVAGTAVTFTAPATGASAIFSASGSNTVTVGTDANGAAAAPMLSASDLAGSYTVTAASAYGSVPFALTNTAAGVAATIAAEAPTAQTASTGSVYADPLQVMVLDANGNPVQGASVTFTLGTAGAGGSGGSGSPSGAGASAGATFDGGQSMAAVSTSSAGVATSPRFTANAVAGRFTASATTAGVTEPAAFSLDNLAGKPPKLTARGSTRLSTTVGTRYAETLQVEVLDAKGTPLQGVTVTFTLGSAAGGAGGLGAGGAGSAGASFLDGTTQASETTGSAGLASSPLFRANGTAGTFSATAAVADVINPLTFALHNLADKPNTVARVGSGRGSATVGGRYPRRLAIVVRHANGKPVRGIRVTFTLGGAGSAGGAGGGASAGASFTGGATQATATTGPRGTAVSPAFTANGMAGTFTATASASGIARAVHFTLRNRAGVPATVTAGVGASQDTTVATRFVVALAVTVTDAKDNPAPGVAVTFTAPTAGAGGTFDGGSATVTVTTDSHGVAVAPAFTANGVAGGYVVTASVSGAHSAAFALVNLAR